MSDSSSPATVCPACEESLDRVAFECQNCDDLYCRDHRTVDEHDCSGSETDYETVTPQPPDSENSEAPVDEGSSGYDRRPSDSGERRNRESGGSSTGLAITVGIWLLTVAYLVVATPRSPLGVVALGAFASFPFLYWDAHVAKRTGALALGYPILIPLASLSLWPLAVPVYWVVRFFSEPDPARSGDERIVSVDHEGPPNRSPPTHAQMDNRRPADADHHSGDRWEAKPYASDDTRRQRPQVSEGHQHHSEGSGRSRRSRSTGSNEGLGRPDHGPAPEGSEAGRHAADRPDGDRYGPDTDRHDPETEDGENGRTGAFPPTDRDDEESGRETEREY